MLKHLLIKQVANAIHRAATSLSRRQKHGLLLAIDTLLFLLAIYGAFGLCFNSLLPIEEIQANASLILLIILIKPLIFIVMSMYRPVLRYAGLEFLLTAAQAVLLSSATIIILAHLLKFLQLPYSIIINDALLTLLLVVSLRLFMRWLAYNWIFSVNKNTCPERIIIYGAGMAGSQLAQSLASHKAYQLVAFVDDDRSLHNQIVQGLPVYPPEDLPKLIVQNSVDTILLAMPSLDRSTKRSILNRLQPLSIPVKTVPSIGEILSGKTPISEIRNIDIVDLLGREEVLPDPELLRMNLTGKTVMVTGAGGSIGTELCRQIAQQAPKCLILYEMSEYALYSIDMEIAENYPSIKRIACLGSVTDSARLSAVIYKNKVDTIYHAAAYKHVPLVEANPTQGVVNNVLGTLTTARCAIDGGVSKFVLISTDKAVRPTNVMGATKRVAELILQALAELPEITTCLTMVRFGNVLDSSGSVVPRFRKQIANGKPITLTHPDITRYFMSIPEAARLVIQAGALSKGGEIFLLDMGEPVRIYDLAVQMIQLSGLVPGRDIEIKITGLRPGEKLYEELLIEPENVTPTRHPKIFCAKEKAKMKWEVLQPRLESLFAKARRDDHNGIITELQNLVPEYKPVRLELPRTA